MGICTPFIILYDIMPQIIPYVATSTVPIMLSAIYNLIGLALIGAIPWSEVNWGIMINTATGLLWSSILHAGYALSACSSRRNRPSPSSAHNVLTLARNNIQSKTKRKRINLLPRLSNNLI